MKKCIYKIIPLFAIILLPIFGFGQGQGAAQQQPSTQEQVVPKQQKPIPNNPQKDTGNEGSGFIDGVSGNVGTVADNVGNVADKVTNIISVSNIMTAIVILFMIWFTTRLNNWSVKYLADRFNRHRLKIMRAKPIINVFLWVTGLSSLIFTLFHPSQEVLIGLMGSSALALGFAAQDIVKNIFGGLLILFDRPFQIGDRVNIDNSYGEVMNIGLRNTQINTLDDSIVTVPNAKIISDNVSNANSGALDCMVVVDLWLPIDINVETVRKIAFESAITSRYLNIDKAVVILFFDHFDNKPATNVKIKAYVLDARYEKAFAGDVTEAAKKALKSAGAYSTRREMAKIE